MTRFIYKLTHTDEAVENVIASAIICHESEDQAKQLWYKCWGYKTEQINIHIKVIGIANENIEAGFLSINIG